MAAPPDLINDPPSLICRYKDRRQAPISFSFSLVSALLPFATHGHQKSVDGASRRGREQTFISVLERANARKGVLDTRPISLLLFESSTTTLSPAFRPFCHFLRLDTARGTTVRRIVPSKLCWMVESPTHLFRHRSLYIMNNHLIPKNSRYPYIFASDDKKVTFFPNRFLFIWVYMEIFSTTNMYKWK